MLSSQTSKEMPTQPLMQVSMLNNAVVNAAASPRVTSIYKPAITMATVQIPQMRVLQAIVSKSGQTQHFQHPVQTQPGHQAQTQQLHQIQILKAIPSSRGDIFIPTTLSTLTGGKTSFISPSKGPNVVTIPTSKVVPGSNKLRVGDTIVIPADALNTINPGGAVGTQSIVIKNEQGVSVTAAGQLVFSTPTKLMPSVARSPMLGSPATPQQCAQIRNTSCQQPSTPLSSSLSSPSRITTVSPSSWTPSPMRYKRPNEYCDQDSLQDSIKKSRRSLSAHEKGSKGLRHFAMLVCEKVKKKITTTYNEVADELVSEYSNAQRHLNDQQYDQKNIRRRVYDALNVLMAMNIIYKDKKDIHWVGLPTNSAQELQSLQSEKQNREQRIKQKTAQLHELILQQIAFKNLVQRNKKLQHAHGLPASNSAIQLPFIIVNTSKKTVIDCSISNDKYEYLFNFDNTFEIHDDIEVLKRMGMAYGLEKGTCSKEDLGMAQSLVPPVLRSYLQEMAGHRHLEDSSTSTSSSQTISSGSDSQLSIGTNTAQMANSPPFDGHQLLSSIKRDPDELDVPMIIDDNEESRSRNTSMVAIGPSSAKCSSPVDVLNVLQQSVTDSSPGFGLGCSLSPTNFET